MSKKESGLRQLLKAIKEGSRESFPASLLPAEGTGSYLYIFLPTWPDSRIS